MPMWIKRLCAVFLVCTIMTGAAVLPASAVETEGATLYLEDLKYELVDWSTVQYFDYVSDSRTTALFDVELPSRQIAAMDLVLTLQASSTVRFECTYSPSSASMDFGLVDATGHFYYLSASDGNINRTIRIKTGGMYTVAIRNNSDGAVTVVGNIYY